MCDPAKMLPILLLVALLSILKPVVSDSDCAMCWLILALTLASADDCMLSSVKSTVVAAACSDANRDTHGGGVEYCGGADAIVELVASEAKGGKELWEVNACFGLIDDFCKLRGLLGEESGMVGEFAERVVVPYDGGARVLAGARVL